MRIRILQTCLHRYILFYIDWFPQVRLSAAANDPYQAAVARVGGGGGAQRQDLVAAPPQAPNGLQAWHP